MVMEGKSEWNHSALIGATGRIDVELAGLGSQEFVKPYLESGTVHRRSGRGIRRWRWLL
jgi:hypothetical protein